MCVSTVVSEYMEDVWGRKREDVDALAEEAMADISVRAEAVGEGEGEGSWEDLSGERRADVRASLFVSGRCGCEACATDVSILRGEDVMTPI
jgi:hypothetical protein